MVKGAAKFGLLLFVSLYLGFNSNAVRQTFAVIFNAWLGGFKELPKSSEFMTIEEVGAYLNSEFFVHI